MVSFSAPLHPHPEAPIRPSPVLLGHFPLLLSLLHPGFLLHPKSSFSTTLWCPQVSPGHHSPRAGAGPGLFQPQHPLSSSSSPQYFPKDQLENDFSISEIHQGKQFPSFIPRSKPELTFFLLHFPLTQPFFSPFLSSHCFTPVFAPEGSVIPAGCSRALTAPPPSPRHSGAGGSRRRPALPRATATETGAQIALGLFKG